MTKKIIDFIGFPTDLGAGCAGCTLGPDALRQFGLNRFTQNNAANYQDLGNIPILQRHDVDEENSQLKRLSPIVDSSQKLAEQFTASLQNGHIPVCLGGDHSLSLGSVLGVSNCYKNKEDIAVIWIDAHPDMNTAEASPSGNIHGMPLAANLGIGDKKLVELGGYFPKILPHNTFLFAIRDIDDGEKKLLSEMSINCTYADQILSSDFQNLIQNTFSGLRTKYKHIHISFDIDSTDPAYAPGVGTPVPNGLTRDQAIQLISFFRAQNMIDSFDLVELNPTLDQNDKTVEFAYDILEAALL